MEYIEICKNLFDMPSNYYYMQCISADFAMGAGIAKQFNYYFNVKNKLISKYKNRLLEWNNAINKGECILNDNILCLITKRYYYEKPTYDSLINALKSARDIIQINKIQKLAMPMISCGLDRLNWIRVSYIIQKIFSETDIEIVVCMNAKNYKMFAHREKE